MMGVAIKTYAGFARRLLGWRWADGEVDLRGRATG